MHIYDLDLPALTDLMNSLDEPAYRARQIWQGTYRKLRVSWQDFPDLPKPLRQKLRNRLELYVPQPVESQVSADGRTHKVVFPLQDSLQIETVLMKYNKRFTLCVSSQAGCAMGCVFCATGQMGFRRHLSSGEIVAQVMYFAAYLQTEGKTLSNIVVMGMGEPFHNYANTMQAIDRLNHPEGFAFGARRITISTVGLAPVIRRFADEGRQVNLAISLHAADDALRSTMLPVSHRYGIAEVIDACRYYVEKTHRRVTFEWALIDGVNDSEAEAKRLGALLRGMLCHVNAIPLNPTAGYKGRATSRERAFAFKAELERVGISCTIRVRRGIEISAGCGQLVV